MPNRRDELRRVILVAVILLGGCVSLSDKARQVPMVFKEKVRHCKYIGSAEGSDHWSLTAPQQLRSAINEAHNNGADLGATHVVLVQSGGNFGKTAKVKAYDCPHITTKDKIEKTVMMETGCSRSKTYITAKSQTSTDAMVYRVFSCGEYYVCKRSSDDISCRPAKK